MIQNNNDFNTSNSTTTQLNPSTSTNQEYNVEQQNPFEHQQAPCFPGLDLGSSWAETPYGHLDQVAPTQAYSYKPPIPHYVVQQFEEVFVETVVGVPSYGQNPNPVFQFHHQQGAHSAYYANLDAAYGVNAGVTFPNTANPFHRNTNSNSNRKKMKIMQVQWCEVCNIACDTENVLDLHKSGRKHKKNLKKLRGRPTNNNPLHRTADSNSARKKTLIVQWCEVCKIACDTKAVLDIHKTGQKHRENLEKSRGPSNSSLITPSYLPLPISNSSSID